jgi:hypothetical protein
VPEAIMLPSAQTAENSPQAQVQMHGNTKTAKPKHTIVLTNLLVAVVVYFGNITVVWVFFG